MSDYFNLNEGVQKVDKNLPQLKFKFNRNLLFIVLILLAIPFTVIGSLIVREYRSKAAVGDIARVDINPGSVESIMGGKNTQLSALAYDSSGNPITSGVSYQWSMSSTNTVGTLGKTIGDISDFKPLAVGCGQLTVIAVAGGQSVTKSTTVAVSGNGTNLSCSSSVAPKYSWVTEHVSLQADDFYIMANGKKFTGNDPNLIVTSSGPFPPDMSKAQIDLRWNENNAPMRLLINFLRTGDQWKATDIRTYNGKPSPLDSQLSYPEFNGGGVGATFASENFDLSSIASSYGSATIHFTSLRLFPSWPQIPQQGYYIYQSDKSFSTPSPGSYWGTYGLLFKDGSILTNQTGYTYSWTVDNPQITIVPDPICVGGVVAPCPNHRLKVSASSNTIPGIISLSIKDPSGNEISTATYLVNQASPTPTPIPTSAPTPTDIPTPTPSNSPVPTPTPIPGDYDRSGAVGLEDFDIWKNEFLGNSSTNKSDVNNDGRIDLIDYIYWRNNYQL